VVAKADKEAQKVKDKEQKGTLEFPQMPSESKSSHPGMQSHWEKAFQDAGKKRRAATQRRQSAQQHKAGQKAKPRQKDMGEIPEAAGAKDLEARNAAKTDKKQQGGSLKHKVWPASASEDVEIDELSKKVLGRYVKQAAHDTAGAGIDLGASSRKKGGQTRADVDKHAGKILKRQRGIGKAVDKLSKEEISPMIQATLDKIHSMREDKLSYKERQGLSKSQFALPGKGEGPEGKQGGSYPIPDESHARNALARVSQHGSEAEKATVRRAVHKKFPDIKVSEGVMRELLSVELDETHTPKDRTALDKAIDTYKEKGGKTTVLKPGTRLKGMDPSRKAVIKARKSNEEVEIDEAGPRGGGPLSRLRGEDPEKR